MSFGHTTDQQTGSTSNRAILGRQADPRTRHRLFDDDLGLVLINEPRTRPDRTETAPCALKMERRMPLWASRRVRSVRHCQLTSCASPSELCRRRSRHSSWTLSESGDLVLVEPWGPLRVLLIYDPRMEDVVPVFDIFLWLPIWSGLLAWVRLG